MNKPSQGYAVSANNESGTSLNPPAAHAFQLGRPLVGVFLSVLFGMTLYETCKQLFFHHLTLWQSHAMSICVVSIGSTVAGYVLLRGQEKLWQVVLEAGHAKKWRNSPAGPKASFWPI